MTDAVPALPQNGGKVPAAVIAALLFILMSFVIYVTYYILWGRHRKNIRKEKKQQENRPNVFKGDDKNTRWGVAKDSYCYPIINDILGYEFIKIIKVPVNGQKEEIAKEEQTENGTRPKRVGLTTSTETGNTEQNNEGNVINEPVESTADRQDNGKEENEERETNDDRLPADELDKVESGFTEDEMEDLEEYEEYVNDPFPAFDPSNQMTDEEYDEFTSSNEERLPDTEDESNDGSDQDDERKIFEKMQNALERQQEQMAELNSKSNRIMSEIGEDEQKN